MCPAIVGLMLIAKIVQLQHKFSLLSLVDLQQLTLAVHTFEVTVARIDLGQVFVLFAAGL